MFRLAAAILMMAVLAAQSPKGNVSQSELAPPQASTTQSPSEGPKSTSAGPETVAKPAGGQTGKAAPRDEGTSAPTDERKAAPAPVEEQKPEKTEPKPKPSKRVPAFWMMLP
ncbi:MAG: hypothetical protein HY706_16045 [Candidatus Hydrogenedentes bacterium]|nr:hypothetical protein [Candidatus Hydrogenedentota bacterium]